MSKDKVEKTYITVVKEIERRFGTINQPIYRPTEQEQTEKELWMKEGRKFW